MREKLALWGRHVALVHVERTRKGKLLRGRVKVGRGLGMLQMGSMGMVWRREKSPVGQRWRLARIPL